MSSQDTQHFSVSTWTMIRFLGILLALTALYMVWDIIMALFFAVIIASAIEPGIEWLKARRIPRILGVMLIYLLIAFALFLLIYLIFPLLIEDLQSFSTSYPSLEAQVRMGLGQAGGLPFASFFTANLGDFLSVPLARLGGLEHGIANVASAAFGGIFSFLLVFVFSFYLAAQEKGIESFLRLVTPLAHEPYAVDLWERSQKKLGRWLRAQMLLGAIVGIMIFFGLTLLGLPHAFSFAIIAAVFEIIPVVGPILAAVPAVATAFLVSPLLGVFVIGLYFVVQQIESHVIVPVVMRKTIGLSPLVVVLALLIGARLGGIFGILIAVPLTAISAELLNDWDKKKRALMPE